jgi:hypothetical protein
MELLLSTTPFLSELFILLSIRSMRSKTHKKWNDYFAQGHYFNTVFLETHAISIFKTLLRLVSQTSVEAHLGVKPNIPLHTCKLPPKS